MAHGWAGFYIGVSENLLLLHLLPYRNGFERQWCEEILPMGTSLGSALGHLLDGEVALGKDNVGSGAVTNGIADWPGAYSKQD